MSLERLSELSVRQDIRDTLPDGDPLRWKLAQLEWKSWGVIQRVDSQMRSNLVLMWVEKLKATPDYLDWLEQVISRKLW